MKKLIIILLCVCLGSAAYAEPSKQASLVVDLNTGAVLHAKNEHALRYPASLVKMMTLYLAFQNINQKKLSLNQQLRVSKKAAAMPRTNMLLKAGSKISVQNAILGLIVHSSNDAAVVLAEGMAGSEANFVKIMNAQAKKLGMHNTVFQNASGWPHKAQKSTAYDLAKLAIALKRDFPNFFPWFAITRFTHNGHTYVSHNHIVRNYEWATGLKTGFTCASGFNVATTASQNGKHLVGVVLGGDTAKARDKQMVKLLNESFKKVKPKKLS